MAFRELEPTGIHYYGSTPFGGICAYYCGYWMLLSIDKDIEASSTVDSLKKHNMTDENIRTYWAAKTGDSGEYVILDLTENRGIHSIQINFYEHNTSLIGRTANRYYQYTIQGSKDKTSWDMLVDASENKTDNSHPYIVLSNPGQYRYIYLINKAVPDGNFA